MQHLKWATIQERGGRKIPWYDVIDVEQIIRPVYLQPDPREESNSGNIRERRRKPCMVEDVIWGQCVVSLRFMRIPAERWGGCHTSGL